MGSSKTVAVHPTDGDTGRHRRNQLRACLEEGTDTAPDNSTDKNDSDSPLEFVGTDGEWFVLELTAQGYEMELTLGKMLCAMVADPAFDWAVYGTAVPDGPPSTDDVGPIVAIGGEHLERLGREHCLTTPAYAAFERPNSVALVTALGGSGRSRETVATYLAEPTADRTDSGTPTVLETVPEIGLDPIAILEAVGDWPRDHVRHLRDHADDVQERLVALLGDDRPNARREAVWAIDRPFRDAVDPDACLEPLVEVVGSASEPDVRQTAMELSADLSRTVSEPAMAADVAAAVETVLRNDPQPTVRVTAIEALSDVASETDEPARFHEAFRDIYASDDDPEVRAAALQKAVIYADATDLLFDGLEAEDSAIRATAARILGKFSRLPQSVGSVERVKAVRDHADTIQRNLIADDDDVRVAAMRALRLVEIDTEPDLLVGALHDDESDEVRQAAATALRYQASRDGISRVDPLSVLLETLATASSEQLREAVATTLGAIGDDRAVEPLRAAIDEERVNSETGLKALGEIGGPAIKVLCDRLERALDTDGSIIACATALAIAGDEQAFEPLLMAYTSDDLSADAYDELGAALGRVGGKRAIDPLLTALEEGHDGAVRGLGAVGLPAVEPLLAVLESCSPSVRERAVLALGQTGATQAIQELLCLLPDADPALSGAICQALGVTADERLVPVLRQLSTLAPAEGVRDAADDALWNLCRDLERKELSALGVLEGS